MKIFTVKADACRLGLCLCISYDLADIYTNDVIGSVKSCERSDRSCSTVRILFFFFHIFITEITVRSNKLGTVDRCEVDRAGPYFIVHGCTHNDRRHFFGRRIGQILFSNSWDADGLRISSAVHVNPDPVNTGHGLQFSR